MLFKTWIVCNAYLLLIFICHCVIGNPFGLNENAESQYDLPSRRTTNEIAMEELESGICFWIRCEKLTGKLRHVCLRLCSLEAQLKHNENQLLIDNADNDDVMRIPEQLSSQDDDAIFHPRRQVPPLHACIEAYCHNMDGRAYTDCLAERCLNMLRNGKRELLELSEQLNDLSPSSSSSSLKMNRKPFDRYDDALWGDESRLLEPVVEQDYVIQRSEKRGFGHAGHNCLKKCSRHGMGDPAYDRCLSGCI